MRLTDADVDQWLSELAITMPRGHPGNNAFVLAVAAMVDALALEAGNPAYVYEAAEVVFPRVETVVMVDFDRRS